MRRTALGMLAATLLAAVGACGREDSAAEAPAAPVASATADAPTPLRFENKDSAVEVAVTFPPELARHPALHRRLYDEDTTAAANFSEGARADRAAGADDAPPYGLDIVWGVPAETPRLLSMVREESSQTGGIHPNTSYTTLLWDKAAGKAMTTADLFPPAGHARLGRALCRGLDAAKAERGAPPTGDGFTCPAFSEARLSLVPPARGRGVATGVTAHFSPSEVGAYAEGSYEITLPAAAIRGALAPAYRAEFAG